VLFSAFIIIAEIFIPYHKYVRVLKYLILSLFRLLYEITVGEKTKNKYCKKCYQNLYSKIKCRFCGEEMIKDYYYKHLTDLHPQ